MSLLRKISNADRLLTKNGFLSIGANYSRRSNSNELDSFFKVVSAKPNIRDRVDRLDFQEGGPNWEIFNPKGNRFYLPSSLGLGWQSSRSTFHFNVDLNDLIDDQKKTKKLHFSAKRCPMLIHNSLQELFPVRAVTKLGNQLTVITLSYRKDNDVENGAKNFVIAASAICKILHSDDYWADFVNPFSGKPFYCNASDKKLDETDNRFRSFGTKYEDKDNCLVIKSDVDCTFSGSIFTNAACNKDALMIKFRFYNVMHDEQCERDDERER